MGESQHTQNIQINKVIDEDEKCVFYFTEKNKELFGQPSTKEQSGGLASKRQRS